MTAPVDTISTATRKLRLLLVRGEGVGELAVVKDLLAHPRVDGTLLQGRVSEVLRAARDADLTVVAGEGRRPAGLTRLLHAAGRRSVRLHEVDRTGADPVDLLVSRLAVLAHRPGAGLTSTRGVSVVVTVLNEGAQVDALVDVLEPQLEPGDELIVVDGGSTDGTWERLVSRAAGTPGMTVLSRPGTNISAGRNQGIAVAANPVIACTDAGCSPDPNWLRALRVAFDEQPQPGLVAGIPLVLGAPGLQQAQALACYPHPDDDDRPHLLVRLYGRIFGQVFTPSLPFARSLAFTKEAWAEVGGFPEALGWTEDGVFGRAIADRHEAWTARDARVRWLQRGSLKGTATMYYRYGIGAAQSRNRSLIMRDVARVAAYGGSVALLAALRGRAVLPIGAGAAAYYSLPALRVLRNRAGVRTLVLVPFAMAVKDFGKVAGEVAGQLRSAGRRQSR